MRLQNLHPKSLRRVVAAWVILGVLCAALAPSAVQALASAQVAKIMAAQWCGTHTQGLGGSQPADVRGDVCGFCNSLAADAPPLPAAQSGLQAIAVTQESRERISVVLTAFASRDIALAQPRAPPFTSVI